MDGIYLIVNPPFTKNTHLSYSYFSLIRIILYIFFLLPLSVSALVGSPTFSYLFYIPHSLTACIEFLALAIVCHF